MYSTFPDDVSTTVGTDDSACTMMRPSITPGWGFVQRHGLADERYERSLVDLVTFVQVDGPPGVAVKTGVEQPLRVLELRALHERQLHDALVGLARADLSMVRPHGHTVRSGGLSPLDFLD